ncbi:unnamed protein product [Durusdinium trenchii]|uniref:Uncharacterized protein n=1 Tax=Durusdinium trenchii TaxID=1381693 RepID=A0ABP0LDI5_9DINO
MALCSPCHELETGDAQVIDVETQAVMEEGYSVKKGQQPEPEHCTNPEKDAREATKDAAQHETPAGADGSGHGVRESQDVPSSGCVPHHPALAMFWLRVCCSLDAVAQESQETAMLKHKVSKIAPHSLSQRANEISEHSPSSLIATHCSTNNKHDQVRRVRLGNEKTDWWK